MNGPSTSYRIEVIPSLVPGDETGAARAICATGAVVGYADTARPDEMPWQPHAIVYKAGMVTDLGTNGETGSFGQDGNVRGTIVGSFYDSGGVGQAFVDRNRVMTALPGLGGGNDRAFAINDREQIVGYATTAAGDDTHAILWEPDCTVFDLTALNGGTHSTALDINTRGDIVGDDLTPEHNLRAVVWRNHVLVELDDGGTKDSRALAINDAGDIAGMIQDFALLHAVVWRNGTMVDLNGDADFSQAFGVNNHGDVVGRSSSNGHPYHAALFSNDTTTDLNDFVDQSHWELQDAVDICDDGRIVGNGVLDGVRHGYVLTPCD